MFSLSSILYFQLVSAVIPVGTKSRKDGGNRLSTLRDTGTLSTPFLSDLTKRLIVPKDPTDFQIPKDQYQILPSTKQELDNMLAYSENFLPKPNEDLITVTSERFEKIQADYAKKEKEAASTETIPTTKGIKNILRQNTPSSKAAAKNARVRAFALMTQFVYGARYKLTYGQRLRSFYNSSLDYKIGQGQSLIRDLKQQQLTLYSTMHLNFQRHMAYYYKKQRNPMYFSVLDLGSYIELYAKIVNLDVDLADVMYYVREMDEKRRALEEEEADNNETTTPLSSDEID